MPRKRTCKNPDCDVKFLPDRDSQVACSVKCAIECARIELVKQASERREKQKKDLRTVKDWLPIAQKSFNAFIRLRDEGYPCISCGLFDNELPDVHNGGKWDAGHFLSRGAHPELRFHEDNCHKQCKKCNGGFRSVNTKRAVVSANYRAALLVKIGEKRVEKLEQTHEPHKWTVDELKAIDEIYREKAKDLRAARRVQQL